MDKREIMDERIQTAINRTLEAHNPAIASIDLGTNSCRLLIARVNIASLNSTYFRARPRQNSWKIVDSFSRIVRLGEGLHDSNLLSEDAMNRAIDALKTCKEKIDYHNVIKIRAVATEACRRAYNTDILIERAKKETGIDIEIISAEEEAQLAITGCAGVIDLKVPYALAFDIGGGSTELAWLSVNKEHSKKPGYPVSFYIMGSISLPYGVVTVSEAYGNHASNPKVCEELSAKIEADLEVFFQCHDIDFYVKKDEVQLIGTSGTVTTFAAMVLNLSRYDRASIDGATIDIDDLERVSNEILNMSEKEKLDHPCIGTSSTDLIIVGSAILKGIYKRAGVQKMRIADRGVREGLLVNLLKEILKP
jgi:exopolyphosphatase/guanosine-5'-triphosphate,3'-diphosphate pyrophosphatase